MSEEIDVAAREITIYEKLDLADRRLKEAAGLCSRIEKNVRPMGFHVALTGSRLYGGGTKHDIDLIFYRHDNERLKKEDLDRIHAELCRVGVFPGKPIGWKYEVLPDKEYTRFVIQQRFFGLREMIRVDLIMV